MSGENGDLIVVSEGQVRIDEDKDISYSFGYGEDGFQRCPGSRVRVDYDG